MIGWPVIAGEEFDCVEEGGYNGATGSEGIDVVIRLFCATTTLEFDEVLLFRLLGEFGLV